MNSRIALFEGEIAALEVDAIVIPNNGELTKTDGVCSEIFQSAGPPFETYCKRLAPCDIVDSTMTYSRDGFTRKKLF